MKYHIIYHDLPTTTLNIESCKNSQETIKWIQLHEDHIKLEYIILGQYIDLVKTYTLEEAP